jgi:hypothetical protein
MMMMMTMKGCAILALVFLWVPTITAQECANDGVCDTHERCVVWKAEGECYRNKVSKRSIDDWDDGLWIVDERTNFAPMISHSITPF